jgi:hypothetical protein
MKVDIISWSQKFDVKAWGDSQIEARILRFCRTNIEIS